MPVIKSMLKDDVRIIVIENPRLIDEAAIQQCHREILELLEKTDEKHILLHFGHVAFMSSSALGVLVRIHKKCKEFDISLKLSNISSEIREVFKITGLDKVFSIYADASDAMEAFKSSGQMFFRNRRETRHELG